MTAHLTETSAVYEAVSAASLSKILIRHPVLGRFHKDVRHFERVLKEQGASDDVLWREASRRLRRFRFLSAATPLPFNHQFMWDADAEAAFQRACRLGVMAYPVLTEVTERLTEGLERLRTEFANPLLTAIEEYGAPTTHTRGSQETWAVLLANTRSVSPVETLLALGPRLEIVTATQLRDDVSYAGLLVLGVTSWFPEYCFTAPRAPKVRLLQYEWSYDNPSFERTFLPDKGRGSLVTIVSANKPYVEEEADPVEISVPEIDWTLAFRAGRYAAGSGGAEDVEAYLYMLEGNRGVWLENSSDASVLTISLTKTGDNIVRRQSVHRLASGSFVLLRTGGGGDLIVSVANRALSSDCDRLRGLQNEWKLAFRKRVLLASSMEIVCHQLRMRGCQKASGANIRNWMSVRNISPEDPEDFRAVLTFCGLEARFTEFGEAMNKIDSAHRSAGRRISGMILSAVGSKDTTPLRREGIQVFELPRGEGGGSFTAYRLLERSAETAMIPLHRLNQVFDVEN